MKFKRNNKRRIVANVEMTPLIDVVFQLLIFFMLSSTFVVQTSIPIEIPEAPGANTLEKKDAEVFLLPGVGGPDNEGQILVGEVEMQDWAELSSTLSELNANMPEALVMIYADGRVPTGRTVKVLGIAKSAGIEHYGVAAQPPTEE